MAPTTIDENHVLLYKCLQSTNAKIDYSTLAALTGLTVGAATKRYARLKEKIETSIAASAGAVQSPKAAPKKSTTSKGTAARQRKAKAVSGQDMSAASIAGKDNESDVAVKDEADVEPTVPKRQTRGRKIDYNTMFGDDVSAPGSGDDSEDDFALDDIRAKEEEHEDDLEMDSDANVKRSAKRVKTSMQTPTKASAKDPATPKAQRQSTGKKPTGAAARQATSVTEATAKCSIYSPDKPLPSIEKSPPPARASGSGNGIGVGAGLGPRVGSAKRRAPLNDDFDLKSLQPGTFIPFPAKRQQPLSPIMSCAPSTFVTAGSRGMSPSAASSQDSAGEMLQRELDEVDIIRPEDSVSMVGRGRDLESTPVSPGQNKFPLFRGLLD
ncbi:hypothetical protein A1O1_08998 [Capronia coronata CBS 617.96]|uniref:Myb-like DNA-binding domain-containing protein n=1 Tax=Capronia coronata CBS 617.96 TaxID=1182541 RepID=W9XDP7_9EURO|nr:uncharacterized protein A1O1_08998 [Capronia coronata CBS 617.96]EXJ78597.1 hypothetical protein A1O1_08998 [Capronia coronata CBS 617.96]